MNIEELINDPELKKVLKEIENMPLEQGVQKLLPVIQRMNITPEQVQEMIAQGLSFQNPLGHKRLNPMYEARIVERAQFDGDVPELRTGNLPKGVSPAVPVNTTSMSPALIGAELKIASDEVKDEMLLLESNSTELVITHDPQGYQRGQVPSLRKVSSPSLLHMSQEEKKANTWRFVSTTQGRNSAVPIIERNLIEKLERVGVSAKIGETDNACYRWVVDISSGEKSTHECFDYIGLVVGVFFKEIRAKFEGDVLIKVISVNDIPARKIGWALFTQESK